MYGKESTCCIADRHGDNIVLSLQVIKITSARQGQRLTGLDCLGFKSSSEAWLALIYLQSYARAADAVQTRTLPSQRRPPGSAVRR